jgi:hypothetical protein
MGRLVAVLAEALRLTFRRDELPPAPPRAAPAAAPGRLARLLAPEQLPPPPARPSPSPAPSRGALSLLLAPEPLPSDLPPLPRRGGRWLSWIFAPESLDP